MAAQGLLESLSRRSTFPFFELLHASTDRRHGFRPLQAVEKRLIALGILNDKLSAAVYGEQQGRLLLLQFK